MEPYTFREKIGLFLHTSSYFLMPVTWSIKTIFHGGVLGMIWGVSQPAGKWAALQSGGHIKFPNCWIKCWSFLFFFLKIWTRQSPWHHITDVPSHLALTDFSLQFDVALHIRSIRRTAQDVWPFWIPYLKQCVVSLFVWVKKQKDVSDSLITRYRFGDRKPHWTGEMITECLKSQLIHLFPC